MAYVLIPPVEMEPPERTHPLFRSVPVPRGVSLLVTGSVVVSARYPSVEEQEEADVVYLGGHRYVLSDSQAQVLIDNGFGDCLTKADVYVDEYEESY